MKLRNLFVAALALFLALPAYASQNTLVIPNTGTLSGLTLVNTTNSAINTLVSNNSGASAPSPAYAYQLWADTSDNWLTFTPDGTNFYPMGKFSGSQWAAISNGVPLTIPASTGSSNAYVITYSPVPTALVTGQHYPFISNFANTGAATVNPNGLGAKAIKKNGGTALAANDITSGLVVDEVYDGTNMQMIVPSGNGGNAAFLNVEQAFSQSQAVTPSTVSISTATFTPAFANSNTFQITLVHASCPCTIANPSGTMVGGTDFVIEVKQSSAGSDLVTTWGSQYKFSGAVSPTLSTAENITDLVACHVSDSTHAFCGFNANFAQ